MRFASRFFGGISRISRKSLLRVLHRLKKPKIDTVYSSKYKSLISDWVMICAAQNNYADHTQYTNQRSAIIFTNVVVWPNLSIVGTDGGEVFRETAFSPNRLRKLIDSNAFRTTRNSYYIDDPCTSIDCGGWSNYYHALVDNWPRLYGLQFVKSSERFLLLLARDLFEFERELLDCILPANVEIMRIQRNTRVYAKKYVWLPYLSDENAGRLPGDCLEWYRDNIFKRLQLQQQAHTAPVRKIYISRNLSSKRRYTNEIELSSQLAAKGFQTFYLEQMTFQQQVRLFRQAKIVFARHGAGLTNALFMSPATTVIEHFTGKPSDHYRCLCASLDIDYRSIITQGGNKNSDIDAPIDTILNALVCDD